MEGSGKHGGLWESLRALEKGFAVDCMWAFEKDCQSVGGYQLVNVSAY